MDMMLPKLDARVRPFADSSGRPTKLLAFAELTIADAFVIKGIRVLKREEAGEDEPFVVFPAEKGKGAAADRWFDVAHPVTSEARAAASALVLERWRQAVEGGSAVARG
jgi:stage V sporulation protein G